MGGGTGVVLVASAAALFVFDLRVQRGVARAEAAWTDHAAPAYQELRAEMVRQEAIASTDSGRHPVAPRFAASFAAASASS